MVNRLMSGRCSLHRAATNRRTGSRTTSTSSHVSSAARVGAAVQEDLRQTSVSVARPVPCAKQPVDRAHGAAEG